MIHVDMLRKVVIIAIGGKIGKTFLLSTCNFRNRGRQEHHPYAPTTARFRKKVAATSERARGKIKDDLGSSASYGETLPGPFMCDWPEASKGWTTHEDRFHDRRGRQNLQGQPA